MLKVGQEQVRYLVLPLVVVLDFMVVVQLVPLEEVLAEELHVPSLPQALVLLGVGLEGELQVPVRVVLEGRL